MVIKTSALSQGFMVDKNHVSHGKKKTRTFHQTSCLVGILVMDVMLYHNPHITGSYFIPSKNLNNQGSRKLMSIPGSRIRKLKFVVVRNLHLPRGILLFGGGQTALALHGSVCVRGNKQQKYVN